MTDFGEQMILHYAIGVNVLKQTVVCNCGHEDKLDDLQHLRQHHCEPAPGDVERAWQKALTGRWISDGQ